MGALFIPGQKGIQQDPLTLEFPDLHLFITIAIQQGSQEPPARI